MNVRIGHIATAIAAGSLIVGSILWEGSVRAARTVQQGQPDLPTTEEGARLFEDQIAPLLARSCLDCHDSGSKKGGLDLSRQETVLAGGGEGPAIVPGNPEESPLWDSVETDFMPWDRPALTVEEKQALRRWIELGAPWTLDAIESPALARNQAPADLRVQRLTVAEYIETVRTAVGVDIKEDALRLLPRDQRADGFSNTSYNQAVDLGHVEAFALLAELIVSRMDVEEFASRFTSREASDEHCMRQRIIGMGRRLLRGPLDDREVDSYLKLSQVVLDDGGDFEEATEYVVEAMLQSPRFVYRIESQLGDGSMQPVTDHELASRLSYILWGGPPDEELVRAADLGELSDRSLVAAQVQRMLRDPRAVDRGEQFIHEWLYLDQVDSLSPNPERFPSWNDRLAADMRAETLAFFREVAWERNRPLWELLNAQVTYATPRLAAHYGLDLDRSPGKALVNDSDGLLVRYVFDEGEGDVVHDSSGSDDPIDLKISDPEAVHWASEGLVIAGPTLIASEGPPRRLIDAIKESRSLSIEAWVTPAGADQEGPARIVTLSRDSGARNFTLGQDGSRVDVRLRTPQTDGNGNPSLGSPGGLLVTEPVAVVYTFEPSGNARIYANGAQVAVRELGGDLSNWEEGFRLALANELSGGRPWKGTLHRVSIYDRVLTSEEIRGRFTADPRSARALSDEPIRFDLTSVPGRGGLLTQGSTLIVGGDEASMVARGLFVLQDLLDSRVGNPPPCVDATPQPSRPGLSQRAIAMGRVENPSCGGCHSKFEPLAYGLERFDGIGGYHDVDEYGNELREDGEILFPGDDRPVAYRSSAELMDLLAGSDRVRKTLTRRVVQFAIGRPLVEADTPIIDQIHTRAMEDGGTYASLLEAIVLSDLVQMTQTEPQAEEHP